MSSFQATSGENGQSGRAPVIPEPDYSSDEEDKKGKKENKENENATTSGGGTKYTTTATVVFKTTSPIPPRVSRENGATEASTQELFSKKNMFEELREQSAKITNAARMKMMTTRQASGDEKLYDRTGGQDGQPLSNVMKNVAEFERKLSFGTAKEAVSVGRSESLGSAAQLKTSKSYVEDFAPNAVALKKGLKCFVAFALLYLI